MKQFKQVLIAGAMAIFCVNLLNCGVINGNLSLSEALSQLKTFEKNHLERTSAIIVVKTDDPDYGFYAPSGSNLTDQMINRYTPFEVLHEHGYIDFDFTSSEPNWYHYRVVPQEKSRKFLIEPDPNLKYVLSENRIPWNFCVLEPADVVVNSIRTERDKSSATVNYTVRLKPNEVGKLFPDEVEPTEVRRTAIFEKDDNGWRLVGCSPV